MSQEDIDVLKRLNLVKEKREVFERDRNRFSKTTIEDLRRSIRPKWTLDPTTLSFNLKAPPEQFFPNGYSLLEGHLPTLIDRVHEKYRWELDVLFPEARDERKMVRILGEWEKGIALTPPIMQELSDSVAINDGMNRVAAACLLDEDWIPFYVKREHEQWFCQIPLVEVKSRGEWPISAKAGPA